MFWRQGQTCITTRVYPDHAENGNSHVFLFNKGNNIAEVWKLEAWKLKMPTINAVPTGWHP